MTKIQEALNANGCERLKDFYNTGPVQRAAVESFIAALAQQPVACALCGEEKAFTGSCGGGKENPKALCYTAEPAPLAQQDDSLQAKYLKSELAHTLSQQCKGQASIWECTKCGCKHSTSFGYCANCTSTSGDRVKRSTSTYPEPQPAKQEGEGK
jgi:hypothetical protein